MENLARFVPSAAVEPQTGYDLQYAPIATSTGKRAPDRTSMVPLTFVFESGNGSLVNLVSGANGLPLQVIERFAISLQLKQALNLKQAYLSISP